MEFKNEDLTGKEFLKMFLAEVREENLQEEIAAMLDPSKPKTKRELFLESNPEMAARMKPEDETFARRIVDLMGSLPQQSEKLQAAENNWMQALYGLHFMLQRLNLRDFNNVSVNEVKMSIHYEPDRNYHDEDGNWNDPDYMVETFVRPSHFFGINILHAIWNQVVEPEDLKILSDYWDAYEKYVLLYIQEHEHMPEGFITILNTDQCRRYLTRKMYEFRNKVDPWWVEN